MLKFYGYDKCSTCRKAKLWLDANNIAYQTFDITETSPPKRVLKRILDSGDYNLRELFNTSGVQYRELKIKDKLPDLSEKDAIDLLASNGRLCKRPIVFDGDEHTVGFREDVYAKVWT
jgi:arsenate reductase